MEIRDLFSYVTLLPNRRAALASGQTGREGAFVTWEALVTFPVSSSAITLAWQLSKAVFPDTPFVESIQFPVAASFILGLIFYVFQLTDPDAKDKTFRGRSIQLFLAFVNSIFLAAAVVGIDTTVFNGSTPTTG